MKTRVRAITPVLLCSLLVCVAGCANGYRKAPEPQATAEVLSDSWITTKLKGEQVRGVSGVVAAEATARPAEESTPDAHVLEAKSDGEFDADAEFGRRSLPFFPVFAIRPW